VNKQLQNNPLESVIRRRAVSKNGADLSNDLPEILRHVYQLRGISTQGDIDLSLQQLIPVDMLDGVEEAAQLLVEVMREDGNILIVGDFDADGATSCALCMLAIKAMGHEKVDFLVPNRFEYGYGLTPEIVELALERNPDLIITVDNGISSIAGVAAANSAGIKVVVTDHHLPGDCLPDAAAIVNPNANNNRFPSKAAAGVGVSFYVLLGLRAQLREMGWFEDKHITMPNMANYLDIVALGTVADVVPLDKNNRILVHHGLARVRAGQCRPGILALLEVAGRNFKRVQANDMGFAVGPRLNAAGRLDDMSLGIACLLEEDTQKARELAAELDSLNRERRNIEQDMKEQAEVLLAQWRADDINLPWGLCLFQQDWHQGVIGILASRIKEQFHRPVIAFAPADKDEIKGSARSIPGLHIRDALDIVASRNPHLLEKFGGHAMAAGMSIKESDFEAFSHAFDEVVRELLSEEDLQQVIHSDGAVLPEEITLDTANALIEGGPWGQQFIEPLFDDTFNVLSKRIVGEKHWKLVLRHNSGTPTVDAIAFNTVEQYPELPDQLHIAYRMDVNEWRGQTSLQLRVDYLELAQ